MREIKEIKERAEGEIVPEGLSVTSTLIRNHYYFRGRSRTGTHFILHFCTPINTPIEAITFDEFTDEDIEKSERFLKGKKD